MAGEVFVKRAPTNQWGQPLYEAAGLQWLGEAGAPVAQVVAATENELVTNFVSAAAPTRESAQRLGKDLAELHAHGANHYGVGPTGYTGPGWMGLAPLELLPEPPQSWGQFYWETRMEPYITDVYSEKDKSFLHRVGRALLQGKMDHDEPDLIRRAGHPAARIHGDLWAGNLIWRPDHAVLVDPAAQGGHAEEDLAALELFNAPYWQEIVAEYDRVSPLASGWQDRVCLHQLHILLVHSYLFGGPYVSQTLACAKQTMEVLNV